jgi:hypothetical protein
MPPKDRAEDDGTLDAQRVAECPHVCPHFKTPIGRIALVAAAVSPMVQVDHLGHVGKNPVVGLEQGMVESGTPVEQQQRGPFPHDCPVDNQSRSVDIEPEVDVTYSDSHPQTLQSTTPRQGRRVFHYAGPGCLPSGRDTGLTVTSGES